MKKILIVVILLFASSANAAPFMVCDPQAGVETYKLTGPAWVPASVPAAADGSIKMDVAQSIVGTTSLTVKACKGVWCSDPVPFDFTRPAVAASVNIRLSD